MAFSKITGTAALLIFVHPTVHLRRLHCCVMAGSRRRQTDLTGIRKRGSTYQVRVFSGVDPVTGQKAYLTGSAPDEAQAIALRDRYRREIDENKAARTSITVGYLLDEWLTTHHVEAWCQVVSASPASSSRLLSISVGLRQPRV